MNDYLTDEQKHLSARANDKLVRSSRGMLEHGSFHTPAESAFLLSAIRDKGAESRFFLFGGYEGAERRMAFYLPDLVSELDGEAKEKAENLFAEELAYAIRAVSIKGSGYRTLSHRDYLGSLLALGIERESIGDIVILSEHEAVIFCTGAILAFLLENIDRIAADKVTVTEFVPDDSFKAKREFLPINDTIASPRFDCVVAAITNLSREKAQTAIKSRLCTLDYIEETRPDREVIPPCIISVRGYGKYNIISIGGETRRGRLKIHAEKYV